MNFLKCLFGFHSTNEKADFEYYQNRISRCEHCNKLNLFNTVSNSNRGWVSPKHLPVHMQNDILDATERRHYGTASFQTLLNKLS